MTAVQTGKPKEPHLLRVGMEVYRIYGDDQVGWTIEESDLSSRAPSWYRYRSLDELFFALVNLSVGSEGWA